MALIFFYLYTNLHKLDVRAACFENLSCMLGKGVVIDEMGDKFPLNEKFFNLIGFLTKNLQK